MSEKYAVGMVIITNRRIIMNNLRKQITDQLPSVIINGVIPTLISYYSSDSTKKFIEELNSSIPTIPILYYFATLFIISLFMAFLYKKVFQNKASDKIYCFITEVVAIISSPFRGIYQTISGIIITISILLLIVSGISCNNIKLAAIFLFYSLILLITTSWIDEISTEIKMRKKGFKKQEMLATGG